MPPASAPRSGLTGVVDIGSSKVVCVALAPGSLGHARWVGLGVRAAEGLKCGEITDTTLAESAIIGAIADTERAAGASLDHIILGIGCGRLASLQVELAVPLDPAIVRAEDIRRLRQGARTYAERDHRWSLFEEVCGFRLDGTRHTTAPLECFGRRLEANMTLVTADAGPVGRLVATTERSGLPVTRLTPAPLAAAWAVTTDAERKGGITVVDLGAGFTSVVTYIGGRVARLETVTVGGRQLTQDVAAALQIPFASAERIKTECASVDPAHAVGGDAHAHRSGGGFIADGQPVPAGVMSETRADLCDILSPRLEAMFRHVADHLDALPAVVADSGRLVLTGGGSLLAGLPAYAARLLGRQVRLGKPQPAPGQPSWGVAPAALAPLAAVAGLAEMAGRARHGAIARAHVRAA
jgi:cell division protein FtsA